MHGSAVRPMHSMRLVQSDSDGAAQAALMSPSSSGTANSLGAPMCHLVLAARAWLVSFSLARAATKPACSCSAVAIFSCSMVCACRISSLSWAALMS